MKNIFKLLNIKTGILAAICSVALLATGCVEEMQDPEVSSSLEEILVGAQADNITVTIRSNTTWTASNTSDWLSLSQTEGLGTTDINLMIQANMSDERRSTDIDVTTTDGQKTKIRVTQYGISDTQYRVSPQMITVGAKTSIGHSFVVSTQYSSAVIDAQITEGDDWIKNLTVTENVSGYSKSLRYLFDVNENTDAYDRTGTILVTITFGRATYTEEVTVIQNGLGAPAISTASRAYMMYNQTLHTQDLWVEDGDQTNVRYECTINSAQSGTGSDVPWLTGATVDANGILHITALANNYDEVREGYVHIVAFRNSATTNISVHVIQTGYRTAGLNLSTSLLVHNSEADTYTISLNPINNSTVEVIGNNSVNGWLHDVKVDGNGMLTYSLKAYDGAEGNMREATLTLKVSNGHSNDVYYYLTIRQYAPEVAGISLPTTVITHVSSLLWGTLPINPINGSTVEIVAVSQDWITKVSIVMNSRLDYRIEAYNGEHGPFREGIITLKATNSHANAAYYYITIRQYTPMEAGISLTNTPIIHNHYAETDCTVVLNPLYYSKVEVIDVSETWVYNVEIDDPNIPDDDNVLYYDIEMYDGAQGAYRDAVITLSATNAHVNAAYYYLVIRQYAPDAPGVNTSVQQITHNFQEMTYTIPMNPINHSTVVVEDVSETWITNCSFNSVNNTLTYKLDRYQGGEAGGFRTGTITLKASNDYFDDTYYYITIYQTAPENAAISLPVSLITINYQEILQAAPAIFPLNVLNGSAVSVSDISEAWVTYATVNVSNELEYAVDPYDGAQGAYREAVITLKATNNNIDASYYYITIRQYAPERAAISLISSVAYHSYLAGAGVIPVNALNGSTVTVTNVSAPAGMFTSAPVISSGGDLEYTLGAYDGAQGSSRTAVVTLTATNAHADDATYYVTIVQYAPDRAGISNLVSLITYGHEAVTNSIPGNLLNGSSILSVTSSAPGWLTASYASSTINYSLTAYDGAQGAYREGIITVMVGNAHADNAFYYVTVRQYSPDLPALSLPVSMLTYDYRAIDNVSQTGRLPLNILNYDAATTTVRAYTRVGSWVTMAGSGVDASNIMQFTAPAYDGATGPFRSEVITIEVTNAHANKAFYYVTVYQMAPEAPSLGDIPTYIGLGYEAQTGLTLPLNIPTGTTVTVVSFPAWVTGLTVGGTVTDPLTYGVTEFSGSTATNYVREGIITLSVTNTSSSVVTYYYITVRQYARDMAYFTIPAAPGPYQLTWAWTRTYNSTTLTTSYSGQTGAQTFQIANAPGAATITATPNNGNFTISSTAAAMTWTATPVVANWGTATGSASTVVYITVNAAPYVQVLTLTLTGTQTYQVI